MLEGDQLQQICRALLAAASARHLWDAKDSCFVDGADKKLGKMSHGQGVLVQVALAVWNGRNKCLLGDVIGRLDNENLRMVGNLLVALADGSEAAGDWIDRYQTGQRVRPKCVTCEGSGVAPGSRDDDGISDACEGCGGTGYASAVIV